MPAVWSPHTRKDIEQLERVQGQSTRFIMANYSRFSSVSYMLFNLNLEIKRQVFSTILFYEIINNLIKISPDDLTNTRGHDQTFHHTYARTTLSLDFGTLYRKD